MASKVSVNSNSSRCGRLLRALMKYSLKSLKFVVVKARLKDLIREPLETAKLKSSIGENLKY
jgi:hypothetical protein